MARLVETPGYGMGFGDNRPFPKRNLLTIRYRPTPPTARFTSQEASQTFAFSAIGSWGFELPWPGQGLTAIRDSAQLAGVSCRNSARRGSLPDGPPPVTEGWPRRVKRRSIAQGGSLRNWGLLT